MEKIREVFVNLFEILITFQLNVFIHISPEFLYSNSRNGFKCSDKNFRKVCSNFLRWKLGQCWTLNWTFRSQSGQKSHVDQWLDGASDARMSQCSSWHDHFLSSTDFSATKTDHFKILEGKKKKSKFFQKLFFLREFEIRNELLPSAWKTGLHCIRLTPHLTLSRVVSMIGFWNLLVRILRI